MKGVVKTHKALVILLEVELLQADVLAQSLDILRPGHIAHELDYFALEDVAHKARLLHKVAVDGGDHAALLRVDLNYLHLGKLDERLAHGRFPEDDRRGVQNICLGAAHLAYTVPCNDPAAGQPYALSERPLRRCRGNAS